MNKQKGAFARKGKSILEPARPQGLAEFLADESVSTPKEPEDSNVTGPRENVNTETREDENEGTRSTLVPRESKKETLPQKPVREELRLTFEMGERLRRYAFDKRMKKIDVVTEALEMFFHHEKY